MSADRLTPPGWYPTPQGWGWWDGARWTTIAPAVGDAGNERTLAMFAHLSAFVGGIIVSGIIWGTSDRKPFARSHAREAFNFGLSALIVSFTLSLVLLAGFALALAAPVVGVPVLALGGISYVVLMVLHFVWAIQGAIKASRGEPYEYRWCFRFVQS